MLNDSEETYFDESQRIDTDLEVHFGTPVKSAPKRKRKLNFNDSKNQPPKKVTNAPKKTKKVQLARPNGKRNLAKQLESESEKQQSGNNEDSDSVKENSQHNRLLLERRFYLTASNTKWITFGIKPTIKSHALGVDVSFTSLIHLCDSRGYHMTFTPCQFEYVVALIRRNRDIMSDETEKKMTKITPIKQIQLTKSEYSNQVYILQNGMSPTVKNMSLGISTMQRIQEVECVIKGINSWISDSEYVKNGFAAFEKKILQTEIQAVDKKEFKSEVLKIISNIRKQSLKSVRTFIGPFDSICCYSDKTVEVFYEAMINFGDFICEHLWCEEEMLQKDVFFIRFHKKVLNARNVRNESDNEDEDESEDEE